MARKSYVTGRRVDDVLPPYSARDPPDFASRCDTSEPASKEDKVRNLKRVVAVLAMVGALNSVATAAWASPSPPTNGGNGAGMSGQCTGNPADRPAVCPGT
jgi:hypothetical protein